MIYSFYPNFMYNLGLYLFYKELVNERRRWNSGFWSAS